MKKEEIEIVIDKREKMKMAVICFLPLVATVMMLAYYIVILTTTARGVETITIRNYETLFALFTVCAILSAITLIICLVHLARLRDLNKPTKVLWILVLCALVPVSFVLFWVFQIRTEPMHMHVFKDIR